MINKAPKCTYGTGQDHPPIGKYSYAPMCIHYVYCYLTISVTVNEKEIMNYIDDKIVEMIHINNNVEYKYDN